MILQKLLTLFAFTFISLSLQGQNINGTYLSEYADANYPDNTSKVFDTKTILKIEINDNPNPSGELEIVLGSENIKFNYTIIGNKKYVYIGEKTFITYDAEFSDSKIKCLVGFEIHMELVFVKLENNSVFSWGIKEKL